MDRVELAEFGDFARAVIRARILKRESLGQAVLARIAGAVVGGDAAAR